MFSQTRTVLEQFDNQHDFERMAADILNALGYTEVVPIAPRGGSDEGKDITFTTESGGKGLACVTLRNDIQRKFEEDFSKRKAGEYEKYAFFCIEYLTAQQKRKFALYCLETLEAEFVPYDIEGLRSLLDSSLKSIREAYLHIKDNSKGVSEEALVTLREEIQKQREADKLLLEADKFASSLIEKDRLVRKAIELYPSYKQRELRQLGIEMSVAVIDGYDPIKQMGRTIASLGRGMVGYSRLEHDEIAWLTTSAISYLRESVLNVAISDGEGLLHMACIYGYLQQFEYMMEIVDKIADIDERKRNVFKQRGILLTLLHACGSDQVKLEKLRKRLGIPSVSKETFCKFIQDFDLIDFHGFIEWVAIKRSNTSGERDTFIIKIVPPYVQNKGLVYASALSVTSWQSESISNGESMSIDKLYDELHDLFILICPPE